MGAGWHLDGNLHVGGVWFVCEQAVDERLPLRLSLLLSHIACNVTAT
jgi:hypothetical protein